MFNVVPPELAQRSTAPEPDNEFDLRAALGLLRRHLRLILTTILIVVALAALAVFTLKPVYSASTLVMVDTSHKNLLNPDDTTSNASSDNARVDSEVELVKSETTLLRVIQNLGLIHDEEFGVSLGLKDKILAFLRITTPQLPTGDQALQDVLAKLREALSVQRRGLTYLIAIEARSFRPATAADIANAVAEAYIKGQLEAKINATLASRDILQARIADTSATVAKSEEAFDTFIADNLDRISAETGRTDLLALRQQLDAANHRRAQADELARLAEGSLARRDWQALAGSLKSEAIDKLEADRKALEKTLAGLAEGSPAAVDLRSELAKLDTQMTSAAQSELTSLRADVTAAQAQASDLRTQLRTGVLDTNLPAEVLTSIYELQQNAELARAQYQTMLARLRDLDAQAYLQVADSRIVSQALPPAQPSFPNPPLIFGLAVVVGIGLGVGLAFLLENFVGGFTSEGQVESVLRTKVAATVPRERAPKGKGAEDARSVADYITRAPLSLFAEAVRRVRIRLDQAVRRHRAKSAPGGMIVMVSSAAPNEGKTTIALSLARAYALAGRSTLLIDCDLRKPSIHRHLGLEPSNGLLDYLTSEPGEARSPASFMAADDASGAQVIIGSRRSDVPTDQLLSGRTFSRLIEAARQNFEVVILDTPPIGPVVDGLYLAPLADVIAFVVRWTNTSQKDARLGLAGLAEAKRDDTEILAVLNQQEGARGVYGYRYSRYYGQA
jgi:uncharacterized protein involved in exopolysaccharide biosynthesis/Mrp family chromosome partitioning ATPase